ncbi:peptidase M18 [Fimicolochytrium jonesii]|uniref:peptidase M18 n=1 Tax=Fimicolochytrium jonesii TaxID=1396493 RepID=UPI0022FE57CB|nr:peptidase M18 [Fimicolochytrium jonesii]KAI8817162.1 peptidase M18 [Fimicolochytrium jonesii]
MSSATASATSFLDFVNASPSPFHAVETATSQLKAAGFVEIHERDAWAGKLQKGGKYFFTRNRSCIAAFAVGSGGGSHVGFSVLGAHTDSPCLKVKPHSKKEKAGYTQVGVQTYGGGLWHTWFDRDLGLAGRVVVTGTEGKLEHRLVRIDRPILRVPTLAIHLDRGVNDAFKFNNEVQLTPILAAAATKALNGDAEAKSTTTTAAPNAEQHSPLLLKLLAEELKIDAAQIGDFELCLYDTQPSVIGGAQNEYIFSARLDNLMMSYCSLTALINSSTKESLAKDANIRVVVLFDNEEVGSVSAHGAGSNLLEVTLRRLASEFAAEGSSETAAFERAIPRSLLISADMAHAIHPNYAEKHEDNHRPQMNKGVVIKHNANQRYATTAVTTALVRRVAERRGVPLQEFVVRNDSPCGSTIGPMLSAQLGLRTIDVGNPQLSMHSIRETCGVEDVKYAIDLFESFFHDFAEIEAQLTVD